MIIRFDHAVIAVRDVDTAIEAYTALGFEVAAGGRHPSFGTRNAIVRFGLDYLELLAIEDIEQARARGSFGAELAAFLEHSIGLVGFVFASSRLEDEAHGLADIGLAAEGPFAMERERPDGHILTWRLVIPGSSPWRKPWPFLIEWETPDADRLSWDPVGNHPNRVTGVSGMDLLVDDIDAAATLYEKAFGLSPSGSTNESTGLSYCVGEFELKLCEPSDSDRLDEIEQLGPGPSRLHLHSADLAASAASLGKAGVCISADAIDVDPDRSLGAKLRIVKG
ncbi:MAG: VOC family protein [Gammaproteobacteria bacterium]|nr:VOC family protein [Gammaproteobacteria bacterium]